MSSLKKNTIANFIGQFWVALLAFFLVPVYIHYLGIESYGLLGFFVSLQTLIAMMDLGLSVTANREVAKSRAEANPGSICEVLFTLQYVYFGFGLLILLFFIGSADFIATHWVSAKNLPNELIKNAVVLFGITLGLRWPNALYTGILRGYEKQVRINGITVLIATVKGLGSLILLISISQNLLHLLFWQMICGIAEVSLFGIYAWKEVPLKGDVKQGFSFKALKSVLGFSSTIALISIFAAVIKQLDKVMISVLLPLEEMGYYSTAFQAYTVILMFVTPVSSAVFPRLTTLVHSGNEPLLSEVYHKTSRIIAFVASPVAAIFIFYSYDLLLFWTRSDLIAQKAYLALSFLSFAAILNSVMQASLVLQFAAGLQKLPLYFNIASCFLLTPLTYFLVLKFGIKGGAISWIVFNLLYYSIIPVFTHRFVLKQQLLRWIFRDTLPFILLALTVFGLPSLLPSSLELVLKYSLAFLSLIVYAGIVFFFDKSLKGQFIEMLKLGKKVKSMEAV